MLPFFGNGQTNNHVQISNIEIEGNKRTRENIILRELDFHVGDSIPMSNLNTRIEKNKTLLLATGLFLMVDMNIKEWSDDFNIEISISVKEAGYFFPLPIFELADRNFNVWWNQFNRDFKRVNFGLSPIISNISGRKDLLKGTVQYGYTQKLELSYTLPSINKKQTVGLTTNVLMTRNKEIGYQTQENIVDFFRADDKIMFRRFRYGIGFTYRPKLYQTHLFQSTFYHRTINSQVSELNPEFFLNGDEKQRFFAIQYQFEHNRLDLRAYPIKGHFVGVRVIKEGIGLFNDINRFYVRGTLGYYYPFKKNEKYSIATAARGRVHFQRQQAPYYNNTALGYFADYLRGYELYAIDGMDYIYLKTALRYQIWSRNIDWKKAMPVKKLRVMPLRVFLSTHVDMGYVNDPYYTENNPLANDYLISAGVGLNFVLYIDKVVQVEYSVNKMGEKGLYLHFNLAL